MIRSSAGNAGGAAIIVGIAWLAAGAATAATPNATQIVSLPPGVSPIRSATIGNGLSADPPVWLEQMVKPGSGENFGFSVAIDGTTALVGAIGNTVNGNYAQGAAYVYTETGDTWSLSQMLTASNGAQQDLFGTSVALAGDIAVIGAPFATAGGHANQGAAYVFTRSNGVWSQTQEITSSDGNINDNFGTRVGVSGTDVLVAAPGAYINGNYQQGALYVFTDTGGTWTQSQKLVGSSGHYNDFMGIALSVARNTAVAGTEADGWSNLGKAYVFTKVNGSWGESQILHSNDAAPSDGFGEVVATDGTQALIGAPAATVDGAQYQGAAYLFTGPLGDWTQTSKFSVAGAHAVGFSLQVSGDKALIGVGNTVEQDMLFGAVFLMQYSGGAWTEVAPFVPTDMIDSPDFGWALALSGSDILITDPNYQKPFVDGIGATYFYGPGNVGLVASAPQQVNPGDRYTAQAILTNNAATTTPALSVVMPVPSGATYISAEATQGTCGEFHDTFDTATYVSCALGPLTGDGGSATANIDLEATGSGGAVLANSAKLLGAAPPLSAGAPTTIESSGGGGGSGGNDGGGSSGGGGGASGPPMLALLGLLWAIAALARSKPR